MTQTILEGLNHLAITMLEQGKSCFLGVIYHQYIEQAKSYILGHVRHKLTFSFVVVDSDEKETASAEAARRYFNFIKTGLERDTITRCEQAS